MAVRINGQNPLGTVDRATKRSTSKKADKETGAAQSASEKVSLSDRGGAAAVVQKATAGVSDVDEAKVAEIRDALQRGTYKADLKTVAERIIAEAIAIGPKG
jgi:negative regulator of flagellin synthesis FlgM